jgi:SP family sugar:H+ symporter-like MFS transporter
MTPSAPPRHHFGFILLISGVAALGGFLFGYDSGCINGTVSALQKAFNSSSLGSGFNVASMLLGCAAGAFLAGGLADRFGRRTTLIGSALLFGLSAWGSGIANSSAEFVLYRLLGGFAVGAASIISPAYISEIAPAAYRGRLASLQQMAIVLGLFFAFLVNYLIAQAAGGASEIFWWGFPAWRWMFWAELLPVALFLLGLLTIPESPRYLVAAGQPQAAARVLQRLGDPEHAKAEVQRIEATLEADRRPGLREIFDRATGRVRPIVWVGLALAAFQQLVGINVVFYYGEVLWRAAGFSESDALRINVISGTINVASTLVAIALVDKWGRKPLLLTGSIGMAVFLGILAVVFGTAATGPDGNLALSESAGWVALVSANLYIVAFGMSWGPVMWVMLGEMFPNQVRGAALAVAGFSQWTANFLVTITFPLFLKVIGLGGAYGLYAFFALLSFFFVRAAIRETKGRTLEEM